MTPRRRLAAWLLLAVIALLPSPAAAELALSRITPYDGQIVSAWPTELSVVFNQAVDPASVSVQVVDITGTPLDGVAWAIGDDASAIRVTMPPTGANGVYTVVWTVRSAVDGSVSHSYASFSLGNEDDAAIVTVPSSEGAVTGRTAWGLQLSRFLALAGVLVTAAIWPVWQAVLRPAMNGARPAAGRIMTRLQLTALIAAALAIVGSFAEGAALALTRPDLSLLDRLMNQIAERDTDWGAWWVARVAIIALLLGGFATAPWWFARRAPLRSAGIWLLSLLLPLTLAVTSHAADNAIGRPTAVGIAAVHLGSTALWVGGVVMLAAVVVPAVRRGDPGEMRSVWPALWTRFGALTLFTWSVLMVTGFSVADMTAGNLDAVRATRYGTNLLITLGMASAAGLLTLGMLALLWRLAHGGGRSGWLRLSLLAQLVALAGVLMATAGMDTLPTARDVAREHRNQTALAADFADREASFLMAPGAVGVNHLRLEFPGAYLSSNAEAWLRLTHPALGSKEIQLSRVPDNAFENHGTELSVLGDWQLRLRLVTPGQPDQARELRYHVAEVNASGAMPAAPWRFSSGGGLAGLGLLVVGAAGLTVAIMAGGGPLRKEAGGLALASLALAAVLLVQARIDPAIAVNDDQGAINPDDVVMVSRGEELFQANCALCHGAGLRGDGPAGAALNPPPADFAAPHTLVHRDEDLFFWISNGKQGTGMPGFGASLDDQGIRDIIAFIKHWQQTSDPAARGTPAAAACTTTALGQEGLARLWTGELPDAPARGQSLTRAPQPDVPGDTTNEVMATVEQLVACRNANDLAAVWTLVSPALAREREPAGLAAALAAPEVSPEAAVRIESVSSITYLGDGRVAVDITLADPAGVGLVPGEGFRQVTLVFVRESGTGRWVLDEIR